MSARVPPDPHASSEASRGGEAGVDFTRTVLARCRDHGFALAGVCDAAPTAHEAALRSWLASGQHATMSWLAQHVEARCDPARVLPGARSIIVVADQYASREEPATAPLDPMPSGAAGEPVGKVARYARGRDYHLVIKARLHDLCDTLRAAHPRHAFRAFTDTAPVLEREHAARAGLGWVGKHTLLIHPRIGSYILLGGILSTLHLPPPPEQQPVSDHCGSCTRCIDACPTRAISPHRVDASRCLSYLSIEHRGELDPALFGSLEGWLFGCDICQEVCPHNSPRSAGDAHDRGVIHPEYRPRLHALPLLEVLSWSPADRARGLSGSALKRARLDMLKRHALVLLGERARATADPALREAIHRLHDESELVMRTRAAVLRWLDATAAPAPSPLPPAPRPPAPPAPPA